MTDRPAGDASRSRPVMKSFIPNLDRPDGDYRSHRITTTTSNRVTILSFYILIYGLRSQNACGRVLFDDFRFGLSIAA